MTATAKQIAAGAAAIRAASAHDSPEDLAKAVLEAAASKAHATYEERVADLDADIADENAKAKAAAPKPKATKGGK